jgi:hypothetical protein
MVTRKTGSETSPRLASLASRALRSPNSLTAAEIQELAGSVLGQREGPTVPMSPRKFMPSMRPNPFRRLKKP